MFLLPSIARGHTLVSKKVYDCVIGSSSERREIYAEIIFCMELREETNFIFNLLVGNVMVLVRVLSIVISLPLWRRFVERSWTNNIFMVRVTNLIFSDEKIRANGRLPSF